MWTQKFWKETAERAIKSGAQALIIAIGASEGFNLFSLDVTSALGFIGGGIVVSVATSIASAKTSGDPDSPSLVGNRMA